MTVLTEDQAIALLKDQLEGGHLALFSDAPSLAGAGSGTELSGGGYERVALEYEAVSKGEEGVDAQNKAELLWPEATAVWGEVKGIGIFDAATAGTLKLAYALPKPVTIAQNDQLRIAAKSLQFLLG